MQPKRSGNAGQYLSVLNAASEADASVYYRYGEDGETSVPAANTTRRDRRQSAQRRTRRNSGEN